MHERFSTPAERKFSKIFCLLFSLLLVTVITGCQKQAPVASVPLPPKPEELAKPSIAYLTAEPKTVEAGQPVLLRWSVKDAEKVVIDNGVGPVAADDKLDLRPTATTTFRLLATRGSEMSSAEVTVTVTKARASAPADTTGTAAHVTAETMAARIRDIHFVYGEERIVAEETAIIQSIAVALKQVLEKEPGLAITIEGHCDERGSAEFNIGLGDRRANFVKTSLVGLGIPDNNLNVVSWGKEHPVCLDNTENCFARNRRAHFALAQ